MNRLNEDYYQIIQSYLNTKDYLKLMNVNSKMVNKIKRETIHYAVKTSKDSKVSSKEINLKLFELFALVKYVRNPQKQISLILPSIDGYDLGIIGFMSSSLKKVHINTDNWESSANSFDFRIFNNIPIVHLEGFQNIRKITNGLQGIEELTISMRQLQSIHNMNTTGSLRKLEFLNCLELNHFPFVTESSNDKMMQMILKAKRSAGKAIPKEFRLIFTTTKDEPIMKMNELFSKHLKPFIFNVQFTDWTTTDQYLFFNQIDHLNFVDNSGTFLRNFPSIFDGKSLELTGFVLSSWETGCSFPYLQSLHLSSCKLPSRFEGFPFLKELYLEKIPELQDLPTFPDLRKLSLHEMTGLLTIQKQPHLQEMNMRLCPLIRNVDALEGQIFRVVSVSNCEKLEDVTPFRNAYRLSLSYLGNLRSIPHAKNSLIHRRSKWSFQGIRVTPVANDGEKIRLENIEEFYGHRVNLQSIILHKIAQVMIEECYELVPSTFSLITKSLVLKNCYDVKSLQNLQHIPEVTLFNIHTATDFSGLGHHDRLLVFNNRVLAQAIWSYHRQKKGAGAGPVESHPFHAIFSTIKKISLIEPRPQYEYEDMDDGEFYENEEKLDVQFYHPGHRRDGSAYLWDSLGECKITNF